MISYEGLIQKLNERGLTRTALAEELGISSRTVAQIGRGEKIADRVLAKIAALLKSLKTYTIPIISLVLAIGIAFWRINYLERTNISLSIEIGSTAALQNGEEISLQNPVIWHENEPYVPINEVVSRLGGSIDEKTFTIQQNTVTVVGLLQDNVV